MYEQTFLDKLNDLAERGVVYYEDKRHKIDSKLADLDEAYSAAIAYAENEALPREQWDAADAAVDKAGKAYHDAKDAVDTIDELLEHLKRVHDCLDFLKYINIV